ncbi:MAG TPA: 50S ribosomal protein L33 [Deltaproteobacteria bacterium]|jgi:large subunit ribosomal protein L33|nr:50S ribosomal protein L33 [Pseudomonadota bacterium]NQY91882.1 50S ribosomal protein L33 [Deltaproteobacteria bacterium]HIF63858.1 50S ribosomal protein L33 [Candidatus Binatota bacterium]HIL14402.1 50S ribosomal protein L33 [Deltaproteobacteria bacterium]
MRDEIVLACSDCKRKNYRASRNKRLTNEKLERRKYCASCRTHTIHKEGKV